MDHQDHVSLLASEQPVQSNETSNSSLLSDSVRAIWMPIQASVGPSVDEIQSVLTPRQPTKILDAGDYTVKMCSLEIEIWFNNQQLLENFKHVLLDRYSSLQWTKFLQRDCVSIQVDSGKTVTVHTWPGVSSVWLSGDGKREWYNREFHEILTAAAALKITPDSYRVKRLDSGGFEVEFPRAEYLPNIRHQLVSRYTTIKWPDEHQARVKIPRPVLDLPTGNYLGKIPSCKLTIELSSGAMAGDRTLLVHDAKASSSTPGQQQQHAVAHAWINTELPVIYSLAQQSLQQQEQQQVPPSNAPSTTEI